MEPAAGTGLLPLNFLWEWGGCLEIPESRLRLEYSHLGVLSCSDGLRLLRRGIELSLLDGV